MIYNNNNSERRCTMCYFHPILLPGSSMLIPNRSDAVNAICNGVRRFSVCIVFLIITHIYFIINCASSTTHFTYRTKYIQFFMYSIQ